jgi:competence protein ComEA
MRPSKQFIAVGIAAAAFFLVLSIAPGAIAATKKSATTQKSTSSQTKELKKSSTPAKPAKKKKININIAHQDSLTRLKGIGPEKARAIIDYRRKNGPFKKIEDIMQVKGIGEETFKNIKPFIKVR